MKIGVEVGSREMLRAREMKRGRGDETGTESVLDG